jgi:plastocyanin
MGASRRLLAAVAVLGAGLLVGPRAATAAPIQPASARSEAPVFVPQTTTPAAPAPKARPAALLGATAVIGVDHGGRTSGAVDDTLVQPPAGRNWEYTAYFPSAATVNPGQTIDFHWNAGSLNGEHSVSFAPFPAPIPELITTDPGTGQKVTPASTYNASGPCVVAHDISPAPTAPCTFNPATTPFTSGLIFNQSAADFVIKLSPTTPPGNYFYFCSFHPDQFGELTVVPTTSAPDTQATLDNRANTELRQLNARALIDAQQANVASSVPNGDGTRTWTVKVGVTSSEGGVNGSQVELLGTFPQVLPIGKGDSVKFVADTFNEIHTVTFPHGPPGGPLAVVAPGICKTSATTFVPALPHGFFQQFGCANPNTFESPWVLGPQGASSSISSGSTAASSGALSNSGEFGIPTTQTYKFAKNGTFTYFCQLHIDVVATIYTTGYRETASDGGQFSFGGADFFGSTGGTHINKPVIGQATTPDSQGYWEAASDGGIFAFGNAPFLGSTGGVNLTKPIVGIAATPAAPLFGAPPPAIPPSRGGYWEVASDGGLFAFGNAGFFGSLGGIPLTSPIVGMAPTPSGQGYWMVASDGGLFAFGDAGFFGSLGGIPLTKPIVGMTATPDGQGYWLVASDGGLFAFGDAGFFGSTGGTPLAQPIVGMAAAPDGQGYWMAASDGGIFAFGPSAPFLGSTGNIRLNQPVVAITAG